MIKMLEQGPISYLCLLQANNLGLQKHGKVVISITHQITFVHLMGGESVWPEEDRTGQGRVEGIHFLDHHRTADALMD